ncbi:MAG: hypothetical protein IJO67_01320 [Clostridia bacterium]|nr:hypothetical protein [Clostridia bacterium]
MLYIVRVFEGAAVYEYEYGLIEHAEKHLEMEHCYAELYEWQKGNEVFVKAVNENIRKDFQLSTHKKPPKNTEKL